MPLAPAGKVSTEQRSGSQETGCGATTRKWNSRKQVTMTPNIAAIPVPAWAWALLALAALTILFMVQENGLILSAGSAQYLHEITHDARHALGVPCH